MGGAPSALSGPIQIAESAAALRQGRIKERERAGRAIFPPGAAVIPLNRASRRTGGEGFPEKNSVLLAVLPTRRGVAHGLKRKPAAETRKREVQNGGASVYETAIATREGQPEGTKSWLWGTYEEDRLKGYKIWGGTYGICNQTGDA